MRFHAQRDSARQSLTKRTEQAGDYKHQPVTQRSPVSGWSFRVSVKSSRLLGSRQPREPSHRFFFFISIFHVQASDGRALIQHSLRGTGSAFTPTNALPFDFQFLLFAPLLNFFPARPATAPASCP
jgi:hypothetical protein